VHHGAHAASYHGAQFAGDPYDPAMPRLGSRVEGVGGSSGFRGSSVRVWSLLLMVQELQFWVRRYRGALVCRLWAALDESC
jgi:hypothetical protein